MDAKVAITQTISPCFLETESQTTGINTSNAECQVKARTCDAGVLVNIEDEIALSFDTNPKNTSTAVTGAGKLRGKAVPNSARATRKKAFDFGEENYPSGGQDDLEMDFGSASPLTEKERFQLDYLLKRDPLHEYFNLTCQSAILNSPHINSICHVDTKRLYAKVTREQLPFHQWARWIEDFLNGEFIRLAILRGRRPSAASEDDDPSGLGG